MRGCRWEYVRKSMTLIDRPHCEPTRILRYFESVIEEVGKESFPAFYWQHLEFNLGRCKRYSGDRPAKAPGDVRPDFGTGRPAKRGYEAFIRGTAGTGRGDRMGMTSFRL